MKVIGLLAFSVFAVLGLRSAAEDAAPSQPETKPELIYPEGLISIPESSHFSKYVFVVGKKERILWVYEREGDKLKIVEKFETDVGKNWGEKQKANDHKTPTGIYFLLRRLSPPEIPFATYGSLAFTTDYPNIFDRRDAKTGSGIWLHAVPDSVPLNRGSRGCVVVRDAVIKKLGDYILLGETPLLIFDEVKMLTYEDHLALRKKYTEFFEKWRSSWEAQDIESYIRFYDSTFRNAQMNYDQWHKHKKRMRALYSEIKVELAPPLILANKDQVVIRTLQKYKSNLHQDYGEKTIHGRSSPEDGVYGFKIIREDWQPLKEDTPPAAALAAP